MVEENISEDQKSGSKKMEVLSLIIPDVKLLYSMYMKFLGSKGIFIPTKKPYKMEQNLQLMLQLPNSEEKYLVKTRVVWITPPGSQNHSAGIGVEFEGKQGQDLAKKIETCLGDKLDRDDPTYTM